MLSDNARRALEKKGLNPADFNSDGHVWGELERLRKSSAKPKPPISVCFTGFTEVREAELEAMALEAGFGVNKSVAKSTTHLCGGPNAGPKKLEKASLQGARVVTEEQFVEMTRTGEIL